MDEEFTDGTRIPVGNLELELVATPGHCMGHYCVRMVGTRPHVHVLVGLRLLGRRDHPAEREGLEPAGVRGVLQQDRGSSSGTRCCPGTT